MLVLSEFVTPYAWQSFKFLGRNYGVSGLCFLSDWQLVSTQESSVP